jgi:hypothetical protein
VGPRYSRISAVSLCGMHACALSRLALRAVSPTLWDRETLDALTRFDGVDGVLDGCLGFVALCGAPGGVGAWGRGAFAGSAEGRGVALE